MVQCGETGRYLGLNPSQRGFASALYGCSLILVEFIDFIELLAVIICLG
jgi:hypothetical protein